MKRVYKSNIYSGNISIKFMPTFYIHISEITYSLWNLHNTMYQVYFAIRNYQSIYYLCMKWTKIKGLLFSV